jgi:hypothetical protein
MQPSEGNCEASARIQRFAAAKAAISPIEKMD